MKIRIRKMRKQEAEMWRVAQIKDLQKGSDGVYLSESFISGYSVGCARLLDWLSDQGVIKE